MGKDNAYKLKCLWTKKSLNWTEKVSFKKGLNRTINFYEKYFNKLSKESMKYNLNN